MAAPIASKKVVKKKKSIVRKKLNPIQRFFLTHRGHVFNPIVKWWQLTFDLKLTDGMVLFGAFAILLLFCGIIISPIWLNFKLFSLAIECIVIAYTLYRWARHVKEAMRIREQELYEIQDRMDE